MANLLSAVLRSSRVRERRGTPQLVQTQFGPESRTQPQLAIRNPPRSSTRLVRHPHSRTRQVSRLLGPSGVLEAAADQPTCRTSQPRTPQPPTSPPPPPPSPPKASPTTSTQAYTPVHRCRRVPKRSRTMRCTLCKRRRLSTPSPCIPLRWRLPLGHPSSKPPTPHTLPSTQPCQHHRPMPRRPSSPPPHRQPCRLARHRRPQHPRAHFRPMARTFGPPPPLPPAHLRCR